MTEMQEFAKALMKVIKTSTWQDAKQVVADNEAVLLPDDMDSYFDAIFYSFQNDPDSQSVITEHRRLLDQCRRNSIDAAFEDLSDERPKPGLPEGFIATLEAMESDLVENIGLDPDAMGMLQGMVEQALEENPDILSMLMPIAGELLEGSQGDIQELREASAEVMDQNPDLASMMNQLLGQAFEEISEDSPVVRQLAEQSTKGRMLAWLRTDTWDESQIYLQEHPDLLSDEAELELERLISEIRDEGDEESLQELEQHAHLLVRCREVGIVEAYTERTDRSQGGRLVLVNELASQPDWPARRDFVTRHPILLEEETDQALKDYIESYEDTHPIFANYRMLLDWCREQGVDRAFAMVERLDPETLNSTLHTFMMAETWDECRQILDAYPELLTDDAEMAIDEILSDLQREGNEKGERLVLEHRQLLLRCREVGIDEAFSELTGVGVAVPEPFRKNLRRIKDAERLSLLTDDPVAFNAQLDEWLAIVSDPAFSQSPRPFCLLVNQQAAKGLVERCNAYFGDTQDLVDALPFWQQALALLSDDGSDRSEILNRMADTHFLLYSQTDSQEHLMDAISCNRRAVEGMSERVAERYAMLSNLGQRMYAYYASFSHELSDLQEVIGVYRRTLDEPDCPDAIQAEMRTHLSIALADRYGVVGDPRDLEESLSYQ